MIIISQDPQGGHAKTPLECLNWASTSFGQTRDLLTVEERPVERHTIYDRKEMTQVSMVILRCGSFSWMMRFVSGNENEGVRMRLRSLLVGLQVKQGWGKALETILVSLVSRGLKVT